MRRMTKKKLEGPSLTIKWAFVSSFFIFIVFTIFTMITCRSFISLTAAKEKENVEAATTGVTNRLANANENLAVTDVFDYLETPSERDKSYYSKHTAVGGLFMEMDSFISELGQPELYLFVYDINQKLVFKTQNEYDKLLQLDRQLSAVQAVSDKTGFYSVEPIFSKEAREKIGYIRAFYELSSFYGIRNHLLLALVILEVISLVISSVLGFILSPYSLKPLKVLRGTMDTIRKDLQSDAHMPEINTRDELADISEIFNEMLDRMRHYIEQQEQFVESVSHELRTPVAIMKGHLNLLGRWGKDDPEILDESLKASLQEVSRMKSLVQEMLDLSRAEQVDTQYANKRTDAKQVVYQVFNNFQLVYPGFHITLDDDSPTEVEPKIYRNHFEQSLIILLNNAIKYSTDRKEMHISIPRTMNEFEITVQDSGEGITEEDLEGIFDRFYRVDKARARNKGGNGLGLSIAKQLVENYRGRIDAGSVLHQGTILRIFIPIAGIKEESNVQ